METEVLNTVVSSAVNGAVMNATGQLVFEVASIVISLVIAIVGYYVKRFLTTNEYAKKYNLYNEKTERVLANDIAYAEAKAKDITAEQINKKKLAVSYIERISPDIIKKEGDKLELMIDRKIEQLLQK